jgi:hypothetical protein
MSRSRVNLPTVIRLTGPFLLAKPLRVTNPRTTENGAPFKRSRGCKSA